MLFKGCGKNHPPCPEDYACKFPNGTIIEDYKPMENDTDLDGKCVPKGNCITKFVERYHDILILILLIKIVRWRKSISRLSNGFYNNGQ